MPSRWERQRPGLGCDDTRLTNSHERVSGSGKDIHVARGVIERGAERAVFPRENPGHLGASRRPDGRPGLDSFPMLAPDIGSDPLGAHVARLVLITLSLVIRPVHDHRSLGGRRSALGDGKA